MLLRNVFINFQINNADVAREWHQNWNCTKAQALHVLEGVMDGEYHSGPSLQVAT